MTIDELKSVLTDLDSEVTTAVTPYELSKIVNDRLGTELPPQMFYNYVKKGFITATFSDDQGWRIEPSEVRRWIERYAFRNIVTL